MNAIDRAALHQAIMNLPCPRVASTLYQVAWREAKRAAAELVLAAEPAERADQWQDMPDREGWWLWSEGGREKPERLLIVGGGNHFEVATDDTVASSMGLREVPDDFNYWEMTDVKQMPGTWKFDGPLASSAPQEEQARG